MMVAVCPVQAQRTPDAREALELLGARAISPASPAVSFSQVRFAFKAGRSIDTDWGQVHADLAKLRQVIGDEGGYLNVVLYPPARGRGYWIVHNMRIPPDPDLRAEGITDAQLRSDRIGGAGINLRSPGAGASVPMTAFLDLRPGEEGSGPVESIVGVVIASIAPLPAIERISRLIDLLPTDKFKIEPALFDAEGALGETTFTPPPGPMLLGPPPQPIFPVPQAPDDLAFPLEVIQYDQPNINAGHNQCVPMAHANVIGYLRIRYNHPPLSWPPPHASSAGIGVETSVGDVIFWEPQPALSRIAQIDARTRRIGVHDIETGEGSDICQMIRGTFSDFATQGNPDQIEYRHQGGSSAVYGAGASCDGDVTLPLGGITSDRQGANPTWEWMFSELQLGQGVMIIFGRYDVNGVRVSGHAVRVWGARRFDGRNYIYTLDDGDQGNNNDGLRTTQWEVADHSQPGLAGIPNGRLELGGTNWEIEFAMSAEAKPTLLIP